MSKRVGFISFRISGTDGVSLETKKWAEIFEANGYSCFYMAGELDTVPEKSFIVEEAHFKTPGIPELEEIYRVAFSTDKRPPYITTLVHTYREILKKKIYEFIRMYDLDLIIPQNTLTIPLNIPLALALTEVIAETGIPTIAHHHDFFWERKRFLSNCVWDYFNSSYPPHLNSIRHVVINSSAQNQLALRTGISSTLIPNVMPFERPPVQIDEYNADVREALGIRKDQLLILQPTRVVQRKGIEHAIELVARLNMDAVLVISHASGDEGFEYEQRVREYSDLLGITSIFVEERIDDERGLTARGEKIYTLQDIYPHADLVTYPSIFEGFGNAFLETIYFRKPILVNNYSIYSHDIKPKGFKVIEMDGYISQGTVEEARRYLQDPEMSRQTAEENYRLGLQYYSFQILEAKLYHLIATFWGKEATDAFRRKVLQEN
ncbi:MAG: glycosyltransferase family 4 protein [Spirochaetales bacterium]|nr:glycosyltransferase family 4 protein [Spirochaetales bacterium]